MPKIVISPAKQEDIPAIKDVQEQSWLATYINQEFNITQDDIKLQFSEKNNGSGKIVLKKIQDYLLDQNTLTLVAKENNLLVGFCTIKKHLDHNQIVKLYILPTAQRKGIGTKLFKEATNWFDKKDIKLTVVQYNQKAINFYKKLGFKEEPNNQKLIPINKLISGKALPLIRMRLTHTQYS